MSAPTFSHGLGQDYLSDQQIAQLLRPINPSRVSQANGFSHVEAYEIRAHLNRIVGFARWSEEVISQELVFEEQSESKKWTVCYRSRVALTICSPQGNVLATYTEGATGDAKNQPSRADAHDLALKSSQSQALKRCATNLGDQFGLSLYNKGSLRPLVMGVLTGAPQEDIAEQAATAESIDSHITTPLAPENGEPENPQRETSSPPAQPPANAGAAVEDQEPGTSPAVDSPEPEVPTALAEAFPGATAAPADPDNDPWAWIQDELRDLQKRMPPAEGLVVLNRCLELASKRKLLTKKMPNGGVTLGAHITRMIQQAKSATQAVSA